MTDRRRVLGDLFGPCDALPFAARRRIAALLALPGRPPALLPGELGALPLPPCREVLAAVHGAIEEGLRDAVPELAGLRIDEVVPAIRGRDGALAAASSWPTRLRSVLERNQVITWAALAELTVDDVTAWPGAGPVTTANLVERVIDVSVADWARDIGEIDTSRPVAPATEDDPCLAFLDRALGAAGDDRDRCVFERLVLAPEGDVRHGTLAATFGIGRERIRQLRARSEERVRAAIGDAPEPVRQRVAALVERLGFAAPAHAVRAELAVGGLPALPDSRSCLLLWFVGPYRSVAGHAGWVSTEPAELLAETRRSIHEDGGVRPLEHVIKELAGLGVADDLVDAWLAEQPVRIVDDLVIVTTGSTCDVAERALFACGRAMTVAELASWATPVGAGDATAALWPLLGRDQRFVRVGPDRFELADWGSAGADLTGPFCTRAASPGGNRDERSWLRVEVDAGVLAGASAAVPVELLLSLGVDRGARRTFTTRYGPVAVLHDTRAPILGSLRPVALAVGASVGDILLVGFHHHEHAAEVELARRDQHGGDTWTTTAWNARSSDSNATPTGRCEA